jgi:anti-sigma-K factor RskA
MVVGAMETTPMSVERFGDNGSAAVSSPAAGEPIARRLANQASGAPTREELRTVEPPPRPRLDGPTLAAAAVVAGCAAIALGGWGTIRVLSSDDSNGNTASAAELAVARSVASLLSNRTTLRIPLRHSGGHIVLAVSPGGHAALVLDGLAAAPAGRTYQAWVVTRASQQPVSASLFTGTEVGAPLSMPVPPAATVGVTVERAGGAPAPTRTLRIVATRRAPT